MRTIASLLLALATGCFATTINVVPIHEPLSLHGTDVDGDLADDGEALRAVVMARPMALSGAFPEALVEAIRSPHLIPSNNPNYKVTEANLLVLCGIGVVAELTEEQLMVRLDVSEMEIPEAVVLTARQVLRLAVIAVRRTLEEYQKPQVFPQKVAVIIVGTDESTDSLRDLAVSFTVGE